MQICRRPANFTIALASVLIAVLGGGERAAAEAEKCASAHACHSADFDSNGVVGGEDLARLLVDWGHANCSPADINSDSVVDGQDLTFVLASWGPCEAPAHTKSKIMFIRHAEKPGRYTCQGVPAPHSDSAPQCPNSASCSSGYHCFYGIDPFAVPGCVNDCCTSPGVDTCGDSDSLVTLGWERAGGIAQLFTSLAGTVNGYQDLAKPDYIYAASSTDTDTADDVSKRPAQTVQALSDKLHLHLDTNYAKKEWKDAVCDAYVRACANSTNILISWHHELILPKHPGAPNMAQYVCELTHQCPGDLHVPAGAWPDSRYDMVLVFDLVDGRITHFKQVPQLLLMNDSDQPLR